MVGPITLINTIKTSVMRILIKIFLPVALVTILADCKKSTDFTNDSSIPTGIGYTPVSANPLQDITTTPPKTLAISATSATPYPAGSSFKTELTFFSQSTIRITTLYATIGATAKVAVDSFPYASAFSQSKRLDTLLVPYTLPASAASGTVIRLDYQITNVNALYVVRTVYVKVQ